MATTINTVYLNGCNYQVKYDLVSQSASNNTSTIKVYGVLNVTNNYISWSSGTAQVWNTSVGIGTYYSKGSYTLVQETVTITHNNDGTKTVYVGGSLNTTFVSGSTGGDITLPKINRYPVLASGSNFTDRTNPVFNITAYGTYSIRVRLEASGASRVSRDLSSKNSQTYTLQLTDAERKLLRSLSSNGKTLGVREVVAAVSGGNEIAWSYKDYTMTIVRKPAKVRKDGVWVNAFPYVRVNGQWKEAKPYIRVNGSWKEEK
jgi:hypothetical protein